MKKIEDLVYDLRQNRERIPEEVLRKVDRIGNSDGMYWDGARHLVDNGMCGLIGDTDERHWSDNISRPVHFGIILVPMLALLITRYTIALGIDGIRAGGAYLWLNQLQKKYCR